MIDESAMQWHEERLSGEAIADREIKLALSHEKERLASLWRRDSEAAAEYLIDSAGGKF